MPYNIQGKIKVSRSISQLPVVIPGGSALFMQEDYQWALPTSPGTASLADQCDTVFASILSLAASPEVIDLTSFTDIFGVSASFARVRYIEVANISSSHSVLMGYSGSTSNAWTSLLSNPGQLNIEPKSSVNDACFIALSPSATGWAVSSSNKLLQFDPSSASFQIAVLIMGSSL